MSSEWDLLWRLVVALALSSAIGLEREMRQPRSRWASQLLWLTYLDGHGILRDALALCTAAGFAVADLAVHHLGDHDDAVAVQLELRGPGSLTGLATELGGLDGVLAVGSEDLAGAPD